MTAVEAVKLFWQEDAQHLPKDEVLQQFRFLLEQYYRTPKLELLSGDIYIEVDKDVFNESPPEFRYVEVDFAKDCRYTLRIT